MKNGKRDSSNGTLAALVPAELRNLKDPARELPRLAKNPSAMAKIESAMIKVPTEHKVFLGDARDAGFPPGSVHLVLTSPPYWTLKEYRRSDGQLGWVEDYDEFLDQLDRVWRMCYHALVPGGRLVCVVGDVCLSRRRNSGRHTVVPSARFHPGALPRSGIRQSRADHLEQDCQRQLRSRPCRGRFPRQTL